MVTLKLTKKNFLVFGGSIVPKEKPENSKMARDQAKKGVGKAVMARK